jgi:hypothetical protein
MIYYMEYRQGRPKRMHTEHARDFYQVWFGNDRGQEMFDAGQTVGMPNEPSFVMFGEETAESSWFKKILMGKAQDGYVEFDSSADFFESISE